MMQSSGKLSGSIWRHGRAWASLVGMLLAAGVVIASDRTSFLLPLEAEAEAQPVPPGRYADEALEGASDGWKTYLRLWKSHHEHPADPSIRRFLGLPLKGTLDFEARRGRSSPRWLGWRPGTFAQIDTPHFVIYSRAAEEPSRRVAEDLERCYWIWTQMFYPLWEGAPQVSAALGAMRVDQSVPDYLKGNTSRITIRRKLQIVLFRNAQEYQQVLGRDVPGIERSTGYYNDRNQTTFLYADETEDAATRRHEMVHQLFREATRSELGRSAPGEESGFWLVEGIAGYFESLHLDGRVATVGGWDSPRLQFARYRIVAGGDMMPFAELMSDGRIAAQQREDIARWYAHAIAQTHHLLDGGDPVRRHWVYQQLAGLYKIRAELSSETNPAPPDLGASADEMPGNDLEQSLRAFLTLNDQDLISNPSRTGLQHLCLVGCEVTERGLQAVAPSTQLQWLDLARLPISSDAVRRIAPRPQSLEQLTLEVTRIDDGLLDWLGRADNLREVDLSWTVLGDEAIESLSSAKGLTILWMTGTKVSDRSIDWLAAMPQLESVDIQRSQVSDAGVARLRRARPELQINPLELRSP